MKPLVTVEVDETVPDRVQKILSGVPRLVVRPGESSRILAAGRSWPVALLRGVAPYAHATAQAIAQLSEVSNQLPVVVAERLLQNVRRELEDAGVSYVDATGAVHLEAAPGLLIHIEPSASAKPGGLAPPKGLGAVAVRLIQHLLTDHDRDWTVTELAAAGETSLGQAHNVFRRLDQEGFLLEQRDGKARRRRITNPTDLLDWLSRVPAARKFHARQRAYLYTPDAAGLVTQLAYNALQSDLRWALSGAAAARVWGVQTTTAVPVLMVRVDPDWPLDQAVQQLHLEAVDSGHNVLLVSDVGELGIHGAARNGPVVMAPVVRVWLDMLSEPRGEDAAALFREGAVGY